MTEKIEVIKELTLAFERLRETVMEIKKAEKQERNWRRMIRRCSKQPRKAR